MELKKHIQSQHNTKEKTCLECSRVVETVEELEKHKQDEHREFNCETCGFKTSNVDDFEEHVKAQHASEIQCIKCSHKV